MILPLGEPEVGAPKPNKASRKGKKSWRKNVDMKAVNDHLDEVRFEERLGGSISAKEDSQLFQESREGEPLVLGQGVNSRRREPKKLRCFANLEGLPGVPDPKPLRNRTKLPEERMNPIVKKLKKKRLVEGNLSRVQLQRKENQKKAAERREAGKEERATRRRTVFDFDIWDSEDKAVEPPKDWVGKEALIHTVQGHGQYVPIAVNKRNLSTGSLLPAVEVPQPGASYNPSAKEHQDLLWKAAIVEIQKDKEEARIARQTTAMFPSKAEAPTQKDYIAEMSEGIVELAGNVEDKSEREKAEEAMEEQEEGEETAGKGAKPKTRKQKRDRRGRMFVEAREKREKEVKEREMEVMRLKSLKKELRAEDEKVKENQEKRQKQKVAKMSGNIQLSNYKYEPQEIEIKLSEELTGNLRNLKPEGSLLEDRFKSMQRRNMIEVRVKQKTVKRLKTKKFEKTGHKMGWEENPNQVAKRIRRRRDKEIRGRKRRWSWWNDPYFKP